MDERQAMVAGLKRHRVIRSPEVERAMLSIPRHIFVPSDMQKSAYRDAPLPIGCGQTISAPHMVAIMLEAAPLCPSMNVLEIGAGSGYNAALLASIVGDGGHVYTVERVPELADRAQEALRRVGMGGIVTVIKGDGSKGAPEHSPYDRIYVTCGAPNLPRPLGEQLAEGGIMLVPEGERYIQVLVEYRKDGGRLVRRKRESVLFVPLIGEYGWPEG